MFFFDNEGTTPYYRALMSEGAQSKRLPRLVDPGRLAQRNAVFDGIIASENLPRLLKAVHTVGGVAVKLRFEIDEQGRRRITGEFDAPMELVCQRCLQAKPEHLAGEVNLAVVRSEEQAKQLPGFIEPWIVEEGEADLYSIIEEELLLSLPLVTYHEHDCIDPGLMTVGEEINEQVEAGEDSFKDNPFNVLADLKKRKKSE